MEKFRAAHFTASKELKKRKGFRNKVKNVLSTKTNKSEISVRGKLEASGLGVRPVDISCWRFDPKRMKKNKAVEVQFITDVTSKILESAEAVTPQSAISYREDTVLVSLESANGSEPEGVAEVENETLNKSCDSLEASSCSKCDLAVRDISTTSLLLVSDEVDINLNETDELEEKSASETPRKQLKNRKEKKRNSKFIESSARNPILPDCKETSNSEKNNEKDSFPSVSAVSLSDFAPDSAVLNHLPVHTEMCVPSFESSGFCGREPLILRSEGENSMKTFITTKLESIRKIGEGDSDYVAKVTKNMKEILCSHDKICNGSKGICAHAESGDAASTSDDTNCRLSESQTFVRERLESLSIEESNDCDVSVLRDIFHTHRKSQSILTTTGEDSSGTEKTQFNIHCFENNRFLLIMKSGESVYIRGKLTVSVIAGCVEVLGYKLKPGNELEKHTVFSPRGVSLLSMTSCVSSNTFENDVLKSVCAHNQLPRNFINSLEESDSVLLLERTESNVVDYLSLHLPNKLFPNAASLAKGKKKYSLAEKKLGCEFLSENSEENLKLFCKRDDWDSLSEVILSENNLNETNCTVICGGKGVGKSTLLRFLINRSLSSHEKILCLDFDLGQAEFTVPGCISAVIIKKPLLGPNFTHLLQPERMVFVGDVNVSNCPTQYLESAKFLIDYCKSQAEFQHIPWFVNTMGFCKGLGVELMMNLLHMMSPTNVIQIQSVSNKRNFPKHLEVEYVRSYKSSLKYTSYINRNLYYDLHLIPSAAESKFEAQGAEWGLDSRTMRDIVVMSYLSGMTAPPNYSLTELVPYVCGFKDLKLCVCHETINPNTVLSVMNGSFVALCICEKGEMLQPNDQNLPCVMLHVPVCQCLGFGIIRGVDMEKRQLYVISPLPEDEIQKVNCLMMGTVQLPSVVMLREATCGVVGHVPYTVIGPGQPTGRLSQKSSCHLLLSSAVGL